MSYRISILIATALCASAAYAAPPEGADPNSPRAAWFKSLQTPAGTPCCSEADCRPVQAKLVEDHWEILVSGVDLSGFQAGERWEAVPDNVILKRDNQDGRPIACRFGGRTLCFVPPPSA